MCRKKDNDLASNLLRKTKNDLYALTLDYLHEGIKIAEALKHLCFQVNVKERKNIGLWIRKLSAFDGT